MENTVLLIDDDRKFCRTLEYTLQASGLNPLLAHSGKDGLHLFHQHAPPLIVTDLQMPDLSGIEVLSAIKESQPQTPVIMVTDFGSVNSAVDLMKAGAYDYLQKPFSHERFIEVVRTALDHRKSPASKNGRTRPPFAFLQDMVIGESVIMKALMHRVRKVANSEVSVLLQGESGTGKELIAREIHQYSERAESPFVAVNCATIPVGLFESELFGHIKGAFTGAMRNKQGKFQLAAGGTLFLDEIGELPLGLQPKLLRALQEREVEPVGGTAESVDVRVIAATNRDLEKEMVSGRFRDDLYFRLAVVPITIPPLRDRRSDIPKLVNYFLQKRQAENLISFSSEVIDAFMAYNWPGNIRELENLIEQLIVLRRSNRVQAEDLPLHLREIDGFNSTFRLPLEGIILEDLERDVILQALNRYDWNKTQAAKCLHISRHALHYRLMKYSLLNSRRRVG